VTEACERQAKLDDLIVLPESVDTIDDLRYVLLVVEIGEFEDEALQRKSAHVLTGAWSDRLLEAQSHE
jgi:hypothetical protein